MNKVYRAVDKLNGEESIFLVKTNGNVNVSVCFTDWSDEDEVNTIKPVIHTLPLKNPARFLDAIDPVLIGEFE